jgi:hypothetical protein
MSSVRSPNSIFTAIRRTRLRRPTFSSTRFYAQGYGDGTGDPKGENPQSQGANPSEHKEHPGPPPPSEGHGSGGATKAGTLAGKEASSGKAQPKIHDERDGPRGGGQNVEDHNNEMKNRHDKKSSGKMEDEKVDKDFWKAK